MTGLFRVFDAAVPPPSAPAGCHGVMGYIGGNATHVWTPAEWQPFAHLAQFPIWVCSLTGDHPSIQGGEAVYRARQLGWAPWEKGEAERVIIADLEAAADPAWYVQFCTPVVNAGFVPVAYGSLSTVLGNAASDVFAAAWDDAAVLEPGQTIHGHQYAANVPFGPTVVDYSVVDEWLMLRAGVGPRHGA